MAFNWGKLWNIIKGPVIGIGGGLLSSWLGGKAGKAAMEPSDEERGYLGRQSQLSNLLRGQGETTWDEGMPGVSKAMSYYDTMARGDRAKMSQAVAPSVAQITQQYRGAEGSINRNMRGAQRQQQKGELSRERASRLALLTTGQQPEAYDKMNMTGQALIGHSRGALGDAGTLMSTLMDNSALRRKYGMEVGRETAKDKGGLLGDILNGLPGFGKDKKLPSKNPVPPMAPGTPRVLRTDLGPGPFGGPTSPLPQYAPHMTPPTNNLPPQWPNTPPVPESSGHVIGTPPGTPGPAYPGAPGTTGGPAPSGPFGTPVPGYVPRPDNW